MALPWAQHGSNAWMPRRWSVGGAVEEHRVFLDDALEHVPHLGTPALDHALLAVDVLGQLGVDQAFHDEGLKLPGP